MRQGTDMVNTVSNCTKKVGTLKGIHGGTKHAEETFGAMEGRSAEGGHEFF